MSVGGFRGRIRRAGAAELGVAIGVCAGFVGPFHPASASAGETPDLRSGCLELGLAGSFAAVEGTQQIELLLRGGSFLDLGPGLAGIEMEIGAHRSSLDEIELLWNLSWQMQIPGSSLLPYVAAAAGIRQEWVGSFGESRTPVGIHVGLRGLLGPRVGIRGEYRYHRVLGDPVADFDVHRILFGMSLFLRNGA